MELTNLIQCANSHGKWTFATDNIFDIHFQILNKKSIKKSQN